MRHGNIHCNSGARALNIFVYPTEPNRSRRTAHQPLSIKEKSGIAMTVKSGVVAHHHHICRGLVQPIFQTQQRIQILRQQHIVCVQPQDVIPGGLGKGCIACRCKIIYPGKVKNPIGIGSHRLGAVHAAGVYHNDLIHRRCHALQAPSQYRFLVPYDHTKADTRHCHPSYEPISFYAKEKNLCFCIFCKNSLDFPTYAMLYYQSKIATGH